MAPTQHTEDKVALSCCHVSEGCTLPWGYLRSGGRITVTSRHRGHKHANTVGIVHLLRLALEYRMVEERDLLAIHDLAGEALRGNI